MQDSLYYQEELSILRDLAAEFSREYPSIAPMLAATGADPDVERLLEGTAYLSSFVKQRLDDEFPEIIQGLLQHIYPHYLRPIPSATLVALSAVADEAHAARGIELHSVKADGMVCRFTTSAACRVLPLTVERASLERHSEGLATLSISFRSGIPLDKLNLDSLSIFINGPYADAADAHRFVLDRVDGVTVSAGGRDAPLRLPKTSLSAGGFGDEETLLPWPKRAFRCYRLLQEYFVLPQKFLFWRLSGLDEWRNRGQSGAFTLRFELKNVPERVPDYNASTFVLNVVPAVNIFPHSSEPIRLDLYRREYSVLPQGYTPEECLVYSIRRVASRNPADNSVRAYLPLEKVLAGRPTQPVYAIYRRRSESGRNTATAIAITWPDQAMPRGEILSIDLLCTNADYPSLLRVGDVRVGTESSPKGIAFSNITPPTATIHPPLGSGTLWRLLSHFHASLISLANPEALRKLLGLYVFQDSRDRQRTQANLRRVEAVQACGAAGADRLIRGVPLRGQTVKVGLNGSGFAGYGDMRLFGEVLERFFAEYASINCFTQTTVEDVETGDSWTGRPRLGSEPLV